MMMMQNNQLDKRAWGFLRMESIMIAVAISGILVALAVPNRQYGCRGRIPAAVGIGMGARAALAAYATDAKPNRYPSTAEISDYNSMLTVLRAHGGLVPRYSQYFKFVSYTTIDVDDDGLPDDYEMRWQVRGISAGTMGFEILITPDGVWRCPNYGDVPPSCIN